MLKGVSEKKLRIPGWIFLKPTSEELTNYGGDYLPKKEIVITNHLTQKFDCLVSISQLLSHQLSGLALGEGRVGKVLLRAFVSKLK